MGETKEIFSPQERLSRSRRKDIPDKKEQREKKIVPKEGETLKRGNTPTGTNSAPNQCTLTEGDNLPFHTPLTGKILMAIGSADVDLD